MNSKQSKGKNIHFLVNYQFYEYFSVSFTQNSTKQKNGKVKRAKTGVL